MKTLFFSFFSLLFVFTSKAQVYKCFINAQSEVCDSAKATSVILFSLGVDSLWHAQILSIRDRAVLINGSYKDKNLQIPHGSFTYYASKAVSNSYYIKIQGGYFDGQKHGEWVEYSPDSLIVSRESYKNGIKNGLSETYYSSGKPNNRGYFVNGLKDGEWQMFDEYDNLTQTILFQGNKILSRTNPPLVYRKPRISEAFEKYLQSSMKKKLSNTPAYGLLLVRSALGEDGRILKTSVVYKFSEGEDFSNEFLKILSDSPAWEPAYNEKENKAIKDSVEFLIRYSKFKINAEFQQSAIHLNTSNVHRSADIIPAPVKGVSGFLQDIKSKIGYPKEAAANKLRGRVLINFVVEKDGTLSEFELVKGLEHTIDEEAMRALKRSPKWFPGVQNGQAVRVSFTLPISFNL
jgi:TonB family protein